MKLQWWETNPNSIAILHPSAFERLDSTSENASRIGVTTRTLHRWKTGKRNPTIKNLIKLMNALNIDRDWITPKVLGLKSTKGNGMWRPAFPIEEHPYHTGIIAHGFFDGNECCGVLVYGTLTKEENDDFARLVCQSNLNAYLLNYSKDRKGLPASITQLLKKHYRISSFLSDRCLFSEKLMALALKDCRYRKEILRAAFLDEGYVTLKNGICAFGIKNEKLADQMRVLLDAGEYLHYSTKTPSETQVYLRVDSCAKFYRDVLADMPPTYRKKKRILEFLAKRERFQAKKSIRDGISNRIVSVVKRDGKMRLSDVYLKFGIVQSNKKAFYNRHMRKLKKLGLIETIMQGDTTWVLVPESGKLESLGFQPAKRRGE